MDAKLIYTNNETNEIKHYDAVLTDEGNIASISLKDNGEDNAKYYELLEVLISSDFSLEVQYNSKIADAQVEFEMDAIFISKKAFKRLQE